MSRFRIPLILIPALLFSVALAQEIVVKPGDTLWDLAQRYDTSIEAIMTTNGLSSSDLVPGDTLRLPSGSDTQPQTYSVQAGDTLYDIAVAFNISVDDLIAFNNLDGSLIRVGQVLQLSPSATVPEPEPLVVTIAKGDTLWALAQKYDVTLEALNETNQLNRSSILRPGDNITIPGRYAGNTVNVGGAAPEMVTVSKGDSLWQIAQRYNTSVSVLMAANNLRSTTIKTGQSLRIVPSAELSPAAAVNVPQPMLDGYTGMVWPIRGVITSRFGYRQLAITNTNFHTGLDIDGETGDPIVAAMPGVVTFSGWNGGYGQQVKITAGNIEYRYSHTSELLVNVGDTIEAGQVVALVGSTGKSTGSHLDFEIRIDGKPIDPLPVLQQYAKYASPDYASTP